MIINNLSDFYFMEDIEEEFFFTETNSVTKAKNVITSDQNTKKENPSKDVQSEQFISETPSGLLNEKEKAEIAEKDYPLVKHLAKKLQNPNVPYEELISAGIVGYAKALNSFNKNKGAKFSTYAFNCIQNEMLFFMRKETINANNTVSLNKVISTDKNGNDLCLEEVVSKSSENSLEDSVVLSEDIMYLKKALNYLTEEERFIIVSRYGLNNNKVKTQNEIAGKVKMSQANISKKEKFILDKLKRIMRNKLGVR